MTWSGILVSVRSATEARSALAGGAAIVDVKDPAAGSLGRPAPATCAEVAEAVAASRPWTLACGEVADGADVIANHAAAVRGLLRGGARAPRAIKAGPAGLDVATWRERMATVRMALPGDVDLVAVAYADWAAAAAPPPPAIAAAAAAIGLCTLLVDTCVKDGRSVLDACGPATVADWIGVARGHGLTVAVAGGLALDDVPRAVQCGAAVVALRTAACDGGRLGTVSEDRVRRAVTIFGIATTRPSCPASPGVTS